MASKFKQFLDDIIHGRDHDEPEKEPAQEMQPAPGGRDEIDEIESAHSEKAPEQAPEQEQGQQHWLDNEVERQRGQQMHMPDEGYQVSERDEPAIEQSPEVQQEQAPEPLSEQAPGHEPTTGEITPGQGDIEHGLEQNGTMDRETMSDGLEQGGEMEIEM